jgi:hypothetical protein
MPCHKHNLDPFPSHIFPKETCGSPSWLYRISRRCSLSVVFSIGFSLVFRGMHSFEEAHIGYGSDKAISKYSRFQSQVMVSISATIPIQVSTPVPHLSPTTSFSTQIAQTLSITTRMTIIQTLLTDVPACFFTTFSSTRLQCRCNH